MPTHSWVDQIICSFDAALRTIAKPAQRTSTRDNPSTGLPDNELSPLQKQHIAGLMRVNHAGEVSAQALYQGQALTARNPATQTHLLTAAAEETDHLSWCEHRLTELNSRPSILNPLWYSGSFMLGALAGLMGDKISLGFLAETEHQVTQHLRQHRDAIPSKDFKTHAILQQMIADESKHAQSAIDQGGASLPNVVRTLMHWSSRLLTVSSYYL